MNDDDVAYSVAAALRGRSVAAAESCTAGRVAAVLASVEHAAEFLRGGVVAYHEEVKRGLLGVRAQSVYSGDAVQEMAAAACRVLGADVGIATSGVVGGDPVDGVAPGTVFVGTSICGATAARRHQVEGSPEEMCDAARRRALLDLLDALGATT
jgi:PncC family amidohydrolase